MPTFDRVIDAFLAAREYDRATVSRLAFWSEALGPKELADVTSDDVDDALVRLAERGKLKPARNGQTAAADKPLAPSSINRYISQLQSIYRYAKKHRLLPRVLTGQKRRCPPKRATPHR